MYRVRPKHRIRPGGTELACFSENKIRQMNLYGLETVPIDYQAAQIPPSVKEFKPAIFKHGTSFCCILVADPQAGVFERGETPEEALADWDRHLRERAKDPKDGNYLDEYIQDTLAVSDWIIW
jgi:hypothetical protein